MNTLILILFICISIYSSISWLLPKLLAWLFKRKLKIKLQIGRIAIPKFVLKDVNVSKNGYSIHIDEVSFRSSFFNSDVNKFLSIVIRDVRINNNVEEKRSVVVENILKPLLSKQNSGTNKSNMQSTGTDTNNFNKNLKNSLANLSAKEVLDFRETKLPPSLITFAQFMAIHIYNVSIMVLHGESDGYTEDGEDGWFLHATTNTIHIDGGAGGASRTLLVSASITDASAKLLPRKKHICLGELSCGMLMEVTLKAHGPLSIEKVQCTINSPVTSIHEELYSFLQEFRSSSASKNKALQTDIKFSPGLSEDLFYRLSPVIPKNFSLKIDTTTLTGIQYNDRIEFHASLQSLQINSRFSALQAVPTSADADSDPNEEVKLRLPQVYVAFQMDQLKINTNKEKLLFLNKLKLDAKLEKSVLNLYLIMNVISLTYNHEDVYGWYSSHFQKDKKKNVILTKTKKEIPAWVDNLFSVCVVQGCAELWNVSLHSRMKHGHCNLALGCGGLKIKLDQLTESRMAPYESNIPRLLLGSRHWSTELLVDSGWLAAGPGALNMVDPPQKKQHIWGTTLFLGVALVKWGSHGPLDSKVEAMLDCFKVEWSTTVGHTLVSALGCLQDYSSGKVSASPSVPSRSNSQLTITVALTNVNIFTVIDETMCLMSRIDAVSIDKNEVKSAFVISGLKMVDIVPYKGGWVCQRADEMLLTFFHIKLARIEFTPPSKTATSFLDVQLLESMDMEWSPNLHLKFLTVIREIQRFRHDIRTMLRKGMRKEEIEQSDNGESKNWNVILKGDTCIGLLFSRKNHLLISADEINISKDSVTGVSVVWNTVKAILNGEEIIMVDGLAVERVADDPIIRGERLANEDFVLDWNKVWGVNIVSMRIVLPYRHNFAEAIQGEFVSTFKWLKVVHEIKKKSFTAHSPLPSDLLIKVEEFVLEMSDDPFEVKLRDNCELLEDEYKESLKRKTMLDAKIAELCKPHLFLPAGKVEQLYTALRHKDAQIYVQRSRAAPPPRTRLVACVFGGLEILALADPSIHGTENCIKSMQEIDPESPWPEDGIDFTTLWCRGIVAKCATWQLLLRDFPQPLLSMKGLKMWGEVVGAEQAAPPRALRSVTIDQGVPWGKYKLERGMMPLKIYHDLNCEMEYYSYSFGPCWEPVIAQCNMSFEQVSRPSLDPSLPLAWWDKMRLLLHGRLTVIISQFTCLLHASLDPYNTTEEMELTWTDVALDWTNAKLVFRGELNVYVRTASKYDDCRLLHLPGLRLAVKLSWLCVADPRDHHSVVPCAPDKLPEYSSNQEHDSFRAFRSQGLDMHISLETKPCVTEAPVLLLYGSTLRWFESLKLILSGVTRPTRRGTVFRNVRPRRPQLSRHYRAVRLSLTLHSFQVWYWSSSSMQRGIELNSGRLTCGSEHTLALVPANDGLVRRPRAAWTTVYMNCELNDAEMWLKCIMQDNIDTTSTKSDTESRSMSLNTPTEKCYCLSMGRVSYGREAALGATLNRSGAGAPASAGPAAPPTHRLTVHDLRGAWTKTNRDVAFALFDTYMKTKQLKKNLSTKALKEVEKTVGPPKMQREADVVSPLTLAALQAVSPGGPPHAAETMLAQLVAEAEREPPVVFSDDLSGGETTTTGTAGTSGTGGERIGPSAHGPKHYMEDENVHNSWHIELVNSQVLLKGCETRGYVILCAARAQVRQRVRRAPAPATSWSGEFAAMQYYATVQAGEANELQDIQWVSVDEIQEKSSKDQEISTLPDVPRLVGSGHSAGGVIGSTVGPSSDTSLMQLQRMVSRCACEFYYLSYDDEAGTGVGRGGATGSGGTGAWNQLPPEPYDSFTLMHHDLEVCTNSLQYAMLLDVVNNLVLYVEPERRRTLERRARMRFQLQLHSDKDPRKPIQILQHQVRGLVANLRRLEKESYLLRRALVEHDRPDAEEKLAMQNLEDQVYECKEQLLTQGEELDAMVHAWREAAGRQQRAPPLPSATAAPLRVNEICFKSARWRLTDADGQLGIADLVLTNFLYTKTSRTDDSVEHQLELGYIRVTNLLPREPFQEVLLPQAPSGRAPLARRAALRVFCRDRPPVGGISVKEHLEVNVVPITIGLTKKFFNTMLKFCFPERDPDTIEAMDGDDDDTASLKSGTSSMSTKKSQKKKSKDTNFYVKIEQKDDVEKMKERAEKNKLFIYIKIPEVPVRVSYKGSKEKNLEDVRDMPLVLPTLEYHNVTWTWLDLLLAMKTDTRRVLVSQAIRQRLQLHRRAAAAPEPQEEDKARLLLGDRTVTENKPQKKSVPGVFKFSK